MEWSKFCRQVGRRYARCRFSNYQTTCESQQAVKDAVAGYAKSIAEHISSGRGLVLFGPEGTGKDHLMVATCRAAISAGYSLKWRNGPEMLSDLRDTYTSGEAERDFVADHVQPSVLAVSDPLPPLWDESTGRGRLTDYQASMLFRVFDWRYRKLMPTFLTMNVSGRDEAIRRFGAQILGRIKDGALCLFCDWPSNRKGVDLK